MENLESLTNKRLKKLIAKTEETLLELKQELKRRKNELRQQEVADLENHMKNTELSLGTIRNFIAYLKSH